MKRVIFTSLVVALLSLAVVSAGIAQQPTIYGAYQDCPFHCRTIRINPNHTFEYRLNGDLYNDQRYKGTWRFIGRNKLKANSPVDRSPLKVVEKPRAGATDYSVLVLDPNGAIVSGAIISGRDNQRSFSIVTNEEGPVHVPRCREFELSLNHYRGSHRILNSSAREFVVILYVDQVVNRAIDETWLIEGNRLYTAAEDGTFDRSYWLDKLSTNEARKIFR